MLPRCFGCCFGRSSCVRERLICIGGRKVEELVVSKSQYSILTNALKKYRKSKSTCHNEPFRHRIGCVDFDSSRYDLSIAVKWEGKLHVYSWLKAKGERKFITTAYGTINSVEWNLHEFGSCKNCGEEIYGQAVPIAIDLGDANYLGVHYDAQRSDYVAHYDESSESEYAQFYILVDMDDVVSKSKQGALEGLPVAFLSVKYAQRTVLLSGGGDPCTFHQPTDGDLRQPHNCVFQIAGGSVESNVLTRAKLFWTENGTLIYQAITIVPV